MERKHPTAGRKSLGLKGIIGPLVRIMIYIGWISSNKIKKGSPNREPYDK
jgi:hypothetical protein